MTEIIVIGGGVTGCAVARELAAYDLSVTVLEAGNDVAVGASKANSGIVHAGFDAHPGTQKAKYNVLGAKMFPQVARELDIPFAEVGAYVLGFGADSREKLEALLAQGEENGVEGLKIVSGDEVRAAEKNVSAEVTCALYAPTSGIVSPYEMTIAYAENAAANGAKFVFGARVTDIKRDGARFMVVSAAGTFTADGVVNCAGVHSDEINNILAAEKSRIIPRKGEYMLLDTAASDLTHATLFQLPTAMGKGVLVSRTVHGNILVGPTADDIDDKDFTDTTVPGLSAAFSQAAKSVPSLPMRSVITQFAGIRAHSVKGDFTVGETDVKGFFGAVGIESPGLTSAPAIGKDLARMVAERFGAKKNDGFVPVRNGIKRFATMTDDERRAAIAEDPLYAKVVCRCEVVTEAEIVQAIRRTPGAVDLDGIKRRTRAGMGRCQAGFCTPRLMEILSRETGADITRVTKRGRGSELVVGRTGEEETDR